MFLNLLTTEIWIVWDDVGTQRVDPITKLDPP